MQKKLSLPFYFRHGSHAGYISYQGQTWVLLNQSVYSVPVDVFLILKFIVMPNHTSNTYKIIITRKFHHTSYSLAIIGYLELKKKITISYAYKLVDLDMETPTRGRRSMCVPAIEKLHRSIRFCLTYGNGEHPTLGLSYLYIDKSQESHLLKTSSPRNSHPLILLGVLFVGTNQVLH